MATDRIRMLLQKIACTPVSDTNSVTAGSASQTNRESDRVQVANRIKKTPAKIVATYTTA